MKKRYALAAVFAVALHAPAPGQADAQQAYREARRLYDNSEFAKARELLIKASATDNRNAEVFLWLGKSHYQLGELTDAMAAWETTHRLAPNEPYATRMLEALRGRSGNVGARIAAVRVMLEEGLLQAAAADCERLLKRRALTAPQRASVARLQAAVMLARGKPSDALAALRRLESTDPTAAAALATRVLVGRAKLASGATAEGLALLRRITAEHGDSDAAVTAELEILLFELKRVPTTPRATALARWIEPRTAHPRADRARRALIAAWLRLAELSGAPAEDAALGQSVKEALVVAQKVAAAAGVTGDLSLARQLVQFLDRHYGRRGAHRAAAAGVGQLLAQPLSPAGRRLALGALARHQAALALRELAALETAPADELPASVQVVLQTYTDIGNGFPAQPAWAEQAAFAERARGLVTRLPAAWILAIALPVVGSGDAKARDRAAQTLLRLVDGLAKLRSGSSSAGRPDRALTVLARLLEALPDDHPRWQKAMLLQIDLLDRAAADAFAKRVAAGSGAKNVTLSEPQKKLLAALVSFVTGRPPTFRPSGARVGNAEIARKKLAAHLGPWLKHGYFANAEAAWGVLEPALPAIAKRSVQLDVAELWVEQVLRDHARLKRIGFVVPRQLDETLARALRRLYTLQEGIEQRPRFGTAVRKLWDRIVGHYLAVEYFDVAETALAVRAETAVPAAAEYAELALARLRTRLAERELSRQLARHDGKRDITVTPAFRAALDAHLKFLTDHPGSALSHQAVAGIRHIARVFEKHRAYEAAAIVWGAFAAAAGKVAVVAQKTPGGSSAAEEAHLARARALDAAARIALLEALRTQPLPPPAVLSDEFTKAIAAYSAFVRASPKSSLVGDAIQSVMAVGLRYAQAGAWDVAAAIYKDLLAAELPLRSPERLEFCRGLCALGASAPDRALAVLAQVVDGRPAERTKAGKIRKLGRKPAPGAPSVLATVRDREGKAAAQTARLTDPSLRQVAPPQATGQGAGSSTLSEAEMARLRASVDAAYQVFAGILSRYPHTESAHAARTEVLIMVQRWRGLGQHAEAARLAERFLKDRPQDKDLPRLRLALARDFLALAGTRVERGESAQAMLAVVVERFDTARARLARVAADFPRHTVIVRQAQWDHARSWLTQAQAVAHFSATLARGQFVRASRELQRVAAQHGEHPNIGQVPDMLWGIAQQLVGKGFYSEAITVLSDLAVSHPTHPRAAAASLRIGEVYRHNLKQPIRAAEVYQELNFARGGADPQMQNAIFQIGLQLQQQRRWVAALHVLESFVHSFPQHPNAAQALTLLGSIHQTNRAWNDAIAAFRRVLDDYGQSEHVKSARWSIAACVINLSQWGEAIAAYRAFIKAYANDPLSGEAMARIETLKDLARYQKVVDEKGQRKAFDAQYQIAVIVRGRLGNHVKAIREFRKVTTRWPKSHLADDALYEVGATHLELGQLPEARRALVAVAADYPSSPLADDALYLVGKSYEDQAQRLGSVTRAASVRKAKEVAQGMAYQRAQDARRRMRDDRASKIAHLKAQGKVAAAENEEASSAAFNASFDTANARLFAQWADQETVSLTAAQLADRQDKIDAALRRAVGAYTSASKMAAGDKAGDALLRMAVIYDERLEDADAAMATWLEIVRQFSGTAVAEDASWRIARFHERAGRHGAAIEAYGAFLRNYRRSPKAGAAQISVAESHEELGQWVAAMDAYTNYINNFAKGPFVSKAQEQIRWIKTYRL